jgi:hypothetical protein
MSRISTRGERFVDTVDTALFDDPVPIIEPFVCVISECSPVGTIDNSMIYCINNVLFFSLTKSKYDNITEDGSAYLQLREVPLNYQGGGFESGVDQYETVRHPCQHLVSKLALKFSFNIK